MTPLEKLLRRDDIGVEIKCGKVYLYFDNGSNEWVVKNFRRTVYRGPILDHAVEWFDVQFKHFESKP